MVAIFALTAAVLYGTADFLGGAASRRVSAIAVLSVTAPFGELVVLVAALLAGGPLRMAGLWWGLAGGAAGGAALIVFYAGLAAGPMSVVAPVSALVSTVLPVGVAIAQGERLTPVVVAGGLLCLVAITLVSMEGGKPARGEGAPGGARRGRGLACGIAAGVGFGLFFLFMRDAATTGVLWPAAEARLAGAVVGLSAAALTRTRPVWLGAGRRVFVMALVSGAFDATANICYVLATRAGLFGLAVVITSLYPGVTVLLARVTFGERMRSVQRAGLLLAAVGIVLLTA
ncbi:MAG TPA: DMT family transporter [Streptosporangiaceae bacterium]|jgi:drug/metabolite transporter (DMT)-like permease|nr:DMT family transporter [Streptosporangiaceae bacterium]